MPEIDARKLLAHARALSTRYARQLGPDEAADLAAEALARGLERPPADGRMEPWVERIARNLLVDRWRRAQVAERCPPDSPDPCASPEELALAGERRRTLRRSLARLHRDQRRSILHRYYAEAPAPAGPLATTLRTRLHRGLTRLRELTKGLLSVTPLRLGQWLTLAANPVAVGLLVLAQQSPVAPARPAAAPPAPAPVHARQIARKDPPPPAPAVTPPRPQPAPAPRAQRYDFDDDQVEGELQRPEGVPLVGSPRKSKMPSLIEIPGSFAGSVAKSIEDL